MRSLLLRRLALRLGQFRRLDPLQLQRANLLLLQIDPADAVLTVRVGGEVRAEAVVADQPWPVPDLVSHVSWNRDLEPGDVLGSAGVRATGSVPPGSVVELEAVGIGVLKSRIG